MRHCCVLNGPIFSVRKFKIKLNESTARTFRQKYQSQLSKSKRIWRVPSTSIGNSQIERLLLLDKKNEIVLGCLVTANNQGTVTLRAVVISTVEPLQSRYPHLVGSIDIESSHWAQSLFRRMGFVLRRATTAIPEIP